MIRENDTLLMHADMIPVDVKNLEGAGMRKNEITKKAPKLVDLQKRLGLLEPDSSAQVASFINALWVTAAERTFYPS